MWDKRGVKTHVFSFIIYVRAVYGRPLPMIHIGTLIEAELRRQERSVSWFARKLCCERSNVYSIFHRKSIDTDMLLRISKILNRNFFEEYFTEADRH